MSDACETTHTHLRARARGGTVVHAQDLAIGSARTYYTECGLWFPKDEAVRTAAAITCQRPACVREMMRAQRNTNGPAD